MNRALRHPATLLWQLLTAATLLSWFVSGHGSADPAITTVAVLIIALVKIRLIIWYFMEIRHAPIVWRRIFDAWVVLTGGVLIALFLVLR
jgi:hypothetical protein